MKVPLAQWIEHPPPKWKIPGSSPGGNRFLCQKACNVLALRLQCNRDAFGLLTVGLRVEFFNFSTMCSSK